jgi:hypothetical protein
MKAKQPRSAACSAGGLLGKGADAPGVADVDDARRGKGGFLDGIAQPVKCQFHGRNAEAPTAVDLEDLGASHGFAPGLGLGVEAALGDQAQIIGDAAAAVGLDAPEVVFHQMGGNRVGQDGRAEGIQLRRIDGWHGLPSASVNRLTR